MDLIIETERLTLREMLPTDVEAMFKLDSNPNVHRYLGNNPVTSIEQCKDYIENIRNQYIQNGTGRFVVVLKETGDVIGWAGIKFITEPENNHVNFYDLGYRLQEDHWGKGYASEAAKAWLDYGFNEMKIDKMYASVNKENMASKKILEKLDLKITSEFLWNEIPCYWLELKKEDYLKEDVK